MDLARQFFPLIPTEFTVSFYLHLNWQDFNVWTVIFQKQLSNKTGGKNLSPMLLIWKPVGSEKNWIIKMTTKVQSWTFSLSQCFSWMRLYLVMLHETKFSFCRSNVLFLDEKQAIPTFHISWIVRSLQENLPPGHLLSLFRFEYTEGYRTRTYTLWNFHLQFFTPGYVVNAK